MSDRHLREVATLIMGQSPPGSSCNDLGLGDPLLNGPTEFGGRHPTPKQWTTDSRRMCRKNAVLLCVRGSTTGRTNRADQPYAIGRGVAAIEIEDQNDQTYVYYALLSRLDILLGKTTGSVFPNLSRDDIGSLPVPWPSPGIRSAIANVLGALDDKIEANRRVVALCDESWMVVLKSEEQGEWVPLSTLAKFINGRAFTKGASGDGRMVIRIAELNSGPGASTVYSDADVSPDYLAGPGDLLFAWSGSLTVARWYRDTAIVNQHIFKVLPARGIPMWLVHGRILDLLDYFRGVAADKATTMGHIQRHHLDELVLVPARAALAKLDDLCRPLWRRALKAEQESLRLGALRDALLSKLLSGEVRVRDAESLV